MDYKEIKADKKDWLDGINYFAQKNCKHNPLTHENGEIICSKCKLNADNQEVTL